jgi:transposase
MAGRQQQQQAQNSLLDLLDQKAARRKRRSKDGSACAQQDFLDHPSLRTLGIVEADRHYEVLAEPSSRPTHCPKCEASGDKLHQHDTHEQDVLDARVREKPVHIKLLRHRYECTGCGAVTRQSLEGVDHRRGITERLISHIELDSLKPDESFRKIAGRYGLDEKTVRKIFTRLMKRLSKSWRFEAPRCLGVDEVYVAGVARCILTDVENRRIVNILHKRDMLTFRRHLLQIKHPERIKVIVIDMWRPYFDEALKRFPNAVIVIDKYHVLRLATAAVISVHRRLRKGDKNLRLPKIYLLRKRKHTLTKKKQADLNSYLEELPELAQAHELKEQFLNLWNSLDRREAGERFDKWVEKIPENLREDYWELLRALRNWREEILNYFDYRFTNAFTESANNVIKHMQRVGRGYTFEVTRAKLVYGCPFVTKRPNDGTAQGAFLTRPVRPAKRKKRARRADGPPNPSANVQQLKQIRKAEDEFNELLRPPDGYVARFSHFTQLELTYSTTNTKGEEV